MTRCKEGVIADDFAEQWEVGMKSMQGPDFLAICKALAIQHDTTVEEVARIQRENATFGPC